MVGELIAVMVAVEVPSQPFLSTTTTVYVPTLNPVAVALVCGGSDDHT